MRIALIDTFYDTSHRYWAEGLIRHSPHEITLFTNPPKNWKWQMVGGVLDVINKINADHTFDLIIATDMVNITLLKSCLDAHHLNTPILVYFHENQITYPWSPNDADVVKKRDHHYGWMNYTSAVLADGLLFNSSYHKRSFLNNLPGFIKMFPKFKIPITVKQLEQKSSVLPIGLESPIRDFPLSSRPVFIWNHRWEYDKNPEDFFTTLIQLSNENFQFDLIVVGKEYKNSPAIFSEAKIALKKHILHWGWVENRKKYLELLGQSNLLLVTSNQDFFGISIVEAIAYGCLPILPDRLCYPEHIPEELHDKILYNTPHDMLSFLREALKNETFLEAKPYSNFIDKYLWERILPLYEEAFQKSKKPSA